MKRLIIRADANTEIGLGHVMRCLALAQGITKTGIQPVFVIRDYDQKISNMIQQRGINTAIIPADSNRAEDCELTLKYADLHRATLIVTDLGHAGTLTQQDEYREFLQQLKVSKRFLITIDDLNEMNFPSDIVINPNCGAEKLHYPAGSQAEFLLGPAYFIFRPEFIAAAVVKREIKKEATNVLVAMSGSDPLDLTGKVAGALAASKKTNSLNLCFVLGMDYTDSKISKLNKILKDYRGTHELLRGPDNMAELMFWADIAITGAGLTKYEAAVTGTPSIIIPQYTHLVKLAEEFAKSGATINLGLGDNITEETIAKAITRLLGDVSLRTIMSQKGKALVDGKGIGRIISKISGEVWL